MSSDTSGSRERLHTISIFGSHWLWLVLLGGVLMLAGVIAILVPAVSEIAASRVLGSVLIISGLVQIVQATKMLHWTGFIWHLLLGILAAVGGALIYMDPFAGVVALTLVIAVISAVHGVTQIGFAVKVRAQAGWYWFLVSGVIALIAAVLLVMKLPYSHSFTPAIVAGVSLLFAGWAYVAMALAARSGERARAV